MTELMLETLRRAPALSENYLRRAAVQAARSAELAAALVARTDLPDDVLDTIKRSATVEVKASYLARRDLSAELLMQELRDEKRAGVLVALLANPQASPDALRMVEAVFREKPTVSLGNALLERDVELTTAVALVKFFDKRLAKMSSPQQGRLFSLVEKAAEDDASAAEVARTVSDPELTMLVLKNGALNAVTEARALKAALESRYGGFLTRTGRYPDHGYALVRSCRRHRGSVEFTELLEELLEDTGSSLRLLLEEMALRAGLEVPAGPGGKKASVLERLLVDDDADLVLDQLEDALREDKRVTQLHVTSPLTRRLMLAPSLSAEQAAMLLFRLSPAVRDVDELSESYGLELVRDLVERFEHPDVTAAAITAVPSAALAEDWAGRHPDRGAVLEAAGSLLLTRYQEIAAESGLDSLQAMTYSGRMLPLLMDPRYPAAMSVQFLPWRIFLNARELRWSHPNGQVHQLVADRTSEQLGDDPAAWETFEVLALSHEGTVGELCDIALSLS